MRAAGRLPCRQRTAFALTVQSFGGGGAAAPAGVFDVAPSEGPGPRGSSWFDMHFFIKALRAAPASFWSSAPNLQVAILSFWLTANDGPLGTMASSTAVMKTYRGMIGPFPLRGVTLALKGAGAKIPRLVPHLRIENDESKL